MKAYLELTKTDLRLALRDKSVLFFSYLFPLIFFFTFAELFDADRSGSISQVVSMVLLMGILGNGLFGAGMRTVHDRENHILRRFRVAPISPAPILTASLVTGWLLYIPAVLMVMTLAHFAYGMEWPVRLISFAAVISLGLLAFRALGLILASVANSMQEVNILVQIFYTPMLFLSGALFPITILPDWVQLVSQYLPATYLVSGIQGIFLRNETFLESWVSGVSLLVTVVLGVFLSGKLFRWEKDQKVSSTSKLWVLAVLAPFLFLGTYQIYSQDQIRKARVLYREMQRKETLLIRDARVFVGDGTILEPGYVLVRNGVIESVSASLSEAVAEDEAISVFASGKTLMPGLIDVAIVDSGKIELSRVLSAQLYCGVTSTGALITGETGIKGLNEAFALKKRIQDGEFLGSDLMVMVPVRFIAGYLDSEGNLPEAGIDSPALQTQGKDIAEMVAGFFAVSIGTAPFSSCDDGLKVMSFTDRWKIPFVMEKECLTPVSRERLGPRTLVLDSSGAPGSLNGILKDIIEMGSLFAPRLAVTESEEAVARRDLSILDQPLLQQILNREELEKLKAVITSGGEAVEAEAGQTLERRLDALRSAVSSGLAVVPGSQSGIGLVVAGSGLHRELQLWVAGGIPPETALLAVTSAAAQFLGLGDRVGLIRPGYDANLLLIEGNPLEDFSSLERISEVIYQGERVNRAALLSHD